MTTSKHTVGEFLGVYAALIAVCIVMNFGAGYATTVLAAIRASTRLHERLLTKMLRLPMSFFDTTPLGRIINRFSSDMSATDELAPWNFIMVLITGVSVVGTMVVIAATTPIFLALVPPLVIAYIAIQSYYLRTNRMLKVWSSTNSHSVSLNLPEYAWSLTYRFVDHPSSSVSIPFRGRQSISTLARLCLERPRFLQWGPVNASFPTTLPRPILQPTPTLPGSCPTVGFKFVLKLLVLLLC